MPIELWQSWCLPQCNYEDKSYNVDIAKLTDEGKVDLLKLGILYSDHVVTGNFLKDEFNDVFSELNVSPVKIQGAPEDVSIKFSDYYKTITK